MSTVYGSALATTQLYIYQRFVGRTPAYRVALKRDLHAEIYLDEMRDDFTKVHDTSEVKQVVKPKVVCSHNGQFVAVKAWNPRVLGGKK